MPTDTRDQLDTIISHLARMDKRDRLRTWGGFVRALIGLIPIILLVLSTWYFYKHSDELLQKITREAAKQASTMAPSEDMMKKLEKYLPKK